jgi:hypothetical protein
MSKITSIAGRIRRLERRRGPTTWQQIFVDDQGRECMAFGRILPDGSRGPAVIVPTKSASLEEWQNEMDSIMRKGGSA